MRPTSTTDASTPKTCPHAAANATTQRRGRDSNPRRRRTPRNGFRDQPLVAVEIHRVQHRERQRRRTCDRVAIVRGFWEFWESPTRVRRGWVFPKESSAAPTGSCITRFFCALTVAQESRGCRNTPSVVGRSLSLLVWSNSRRCSRQAPALTRRASRAPLRGAGAEVYPKQRPCSHY